MSSFHLNPHSADGVPPPAIEEVSPGIFAYIQLDGSWGLNNPGFLVGRRDVTLIDTCLTEPRTRAFRESLRKVTDRPVRALVNTHHHADHTWGNFLFPEATIIGHTLCREEMIETGLGVQALFPWVEFGAIEVAPPSLTFPDRLTLYADDRRVDLIHLGPAHTTNDIVAWIPDRRVLFTGDLIFNQCTPFIAQGSLAGLVRALESLRGLGAEIIVPGHGAVCDTSVIDETLAYLHFVEDVARASFAAGVAPLEAARATDLGRYRDWHDAERFVVNIRRAHSELKGEPLGTPLDFAVAVEEMVAYNDGKPLRCLA